MKAMVYIIVRLVSGVWRKGCRIHYVINWGANTLAQAKLLCKVANESFGGQWVAAKETSNLFTVWAG